MTKTTIDQLTRFCQRVLTYWPISGLSFRSRIRNVKAAGSKVTATTWTKMVMAFYTVSLVTSVTAPAVKSMNR